MTEYRHIRSIQQYGLLPGGGNIAGNKQRNMNHFLPIDGLLVSYEHIRPTANVALVLSKATLEQHPDIMENFSLSKNGYFLTKDVITAGLFSLAWDIRNNCCLSTKLWDHVSPRRAVFAFLFTALLRGTEAGSQRTRQVQD